MSFADASPTVDEVNDILGRTFGQTAPEFSLGDDVTFTAADIERLVVRLGWQPTPMLDECLNDVGEFCCPKCRSTRIEHYGDGPCDRRDVSGPDSGVLVITDTFKACCSEGDWWLQCRDCIASFNLPDGLEIEWQ